MSYRRIQNQDVKGSADVASDDQLIHDDKIYVESLSKRLDEAIADNDLSGGGSGGDFNYITNNKADDDTTGWTVYANTTPSNKPDDFGGTPNGSFTWTRNTTTPLSPAGDFKLTKPAANVQGHGVYYEFSSVRGYQNAMLLFSSICDLSAWGDDELRIYLVSSDDSFSTIKNTISPANPDVLVSNKIFKQLQMDDGDKARLCIHIATNDTTAKDAYFDDFFFGPKAVASGAYQRSELVDLTGSGDFTQGEILVKRVGEIASIQVVTPIAFSSSSNASSASGALPSWATPANSQYNVYASFSSVLLTLTVSSSGSLNIQTRSYSGGLVGGTGSGANMSMTYGLDDDLSPVRMSEDLGAREVFASYGLTNSGTLTFPTSVGIINYDTKLTDTTNSVTTGGSWQFVAPESGVYDVSAALASDSAGQLVGRTFNLWVYKNGSNFKKLAGYEINSVDGGALFFTLEGSCKVPMDKGDTLDIRAQGSAATPLSNSVNNGYVQIYKYASPQALLETETVSARYEMASQNIGSSREVVLYDELVFDSHSAYNPVTGEYTIPYAGEYLFIAQTERTGNIGAYRLYAYKNGSEATSIQERQGSVNVSILLNYGDKFDKDDVVTIKAIAPSSSTNLSNISNRNFLFVMRVK